MIKQTADYPIWISNEQAGYDPTSKKWRGVDGRITTKVKALQDTLDPNDTFGSAVTTKSLTPVSDAASKLEWALAGIDSKKNYNYFKEGETANSIPSNILARMKLAEYYFETEGDIAQTVLLPIEVGLRELKIKCSNKTTEKALREFYSEEMGIGLLKHLNDIWLTTGVYGQAFPVIVIPHKGNDLEAAYDKNTMPAIVHLPPKNMWVGKMISQSKFEVSVTPIQAEQWTRELVDQTFQPMMYVSMMRLQNDQLPAGRVPMNPEFCIPIRAQSYPWQRYANPPLSRALRAISTRQALEELVRSTIEGYKNQLWVLTPGDPEHPPSPKELSHLRNVVSDVNYERTGFIIWRPPLTVTQHTPKPLDQLLGNQAWQALTWHIFRQLGVNPRLISGEQMGKSGGSQVDVDVRIMVERIKFWIYQMLRWEKHFRQHWALWTGNKTIIENAPKATVQFGEMEITVQERIRESLMPLIQTGLISDKTALEEAGFDYDTEVERKKDEEKNKSLFYPRATYAQMVVNPDTPSSETQTTPAGRPIGDDEPIDKKQKKQIVEDDDDEDEEEEKEVKASTGANPFLGSIGL